MGSLVPLLPAGRLNFERRLNSDEKLNLAQKSNPLQKLNLPPHIPSHNRLGFVVNPTFCATHPRLKVLSSNRPYLMGPVWFGPAWRPLRLGALPYMSGRSLDGKLTFRFAQAMNARPEARNQTAKYRLKPTIQPGPAASANAAYPQDCRGNRKTTENSIPGLPRSPAILPRSAIFRSPCDRPVALCLGSSRSMPVMITFV